MYEKLAALRKTLELETDVEAQLVIDAVLDTNERLKALEAIAVRQGALVRT